MVDALGIDPDDAAILSVIYEGGGAPWVLRHGSLIFGPPELAGNSWNSWHALNTGRDLHVGAGSLGPTFAHEQNGLLIGRVSLSVAEAHDVLNGAVWASLDCETVETRPPPVFNLDCVCLS